MCLGGAATVRGDVVTVIGRASRHSQARSSVLPVAPLLLLRLVFIGAIAGHVAETGRHPVEILFQVTAAAAATARLEREIVTLFSPEVLMTLTLGPAACATATLQIRQHRLFPGVKAFTVHELADRAVIVVAGYLDRIV